MKPILDLEQKLQDDEHGQLLATLQNHLEEASYHYRARRSAGLSPDDYSAVTALEAAIDAASSALEKIHTQLNMRRKPCPDLISLI